MAIDLTKELDIKIQYPPKTFTGDIQSRVIDVFVWNGTTKEIDSSIKLKLNSIRADWGVFPAVDVAQGSDGHWKIEIPKEAFEINGKMFVELALSNGTIHKGIDVIEFEVKLTHFNKKISEPAVYKSVEELAALIEKLKTDGTTTIDKIATEGDTAVKKVATDGADTVNKVNANATAELNAIKSNNQAVMDSVSAYFTQLQAKVTNGEIKLSAEADWNKLLNKPPVALKSDLDNLKVGGRNLILNSERTVTNSSYILISYEYADLSKLEQGETYYTITVEGELAPEQTGWQFNIFAKNPASYPVICGNFKKVAPNRWVGKGKMPVLSEGQTFENLSGLYSLPLGNGKPATVHRIKVEKGNIPTDWTPAPEDKLNATDYTATDVLNKLKTVDGANSGLDADLLDGKDSAAFALKSDIPNAPDLTPYLKTVDFKTNLLANDGSGSTVDADLLDGQHGTYYAKQADVTTLNTFMNNEVPNTYQKKEEAIKIVEITQSAYDTLSTKDPKTLYIITG